jgi:hypothetical protein
VKVLVLAMDACLPGVMETHPLRLTLGPWWKLMLNHHLEVTAVYPGAVVAHPGAVVAHSGAVVAHPGPVVAYPGAVVAYPGAVILGINL